MIIDRNVEFASNWAITGAAAASRNVSTNIADLGAAGDGFGCLGDTALIMHLRSKSAASGTATSVTVTLETHTAADFSAARTVLFTWNTTVAALTSGRVFVPFAVPPGLLRYLAVVVVPNGGTLTASLDAFANGDIQRNDFRTSAVGQTP